MFSSVVLDYEGGRFTSDAVLDVTMDDICLQIDYRNNGKQCAFIIRLDRLHSLRWEKLDV